MFRKKLGVLPKNLWTLRRNLSDLPQIGSEYKGWKVTHRREIPELGLQTVQLQHSTFPNARYLHLAADDENNAFSVNFKTVPMDSTGIAHILEHTTLCGSKKFPVRDPFFKMLNRSLTTFMNAMTGPDYTLYPFSSQNKKDFYNLLSVYLDSVFQPLLKKQDFRQEGWRLENEDLQNPDSPLIIKGVVFNEMKGAFADNQRIFEQENLSRALPSHTYGICSGGFPEKIPDLTWENLRRFHAKHYSPTNAKFFSYGNLPFQGHIDVINEYLDQAEPSDPVDPVPSESVWTSPRRVHVDCAPDPSLDETTNTTVAVTFKTCDIEDGFETFVLQILGTLLTDGPDSPFYKPLLESGLGTSFAPVTGFESHTKDTLYSIGLQGVAETNTDKVVDTIRSTFASLVTDGFDPARIEAVLHSIELSLKNRGSSFGLNVVMGLTPVWNHCEDPAKALQFNAKVERLRKEMKENPRFLQEKVKEYFVDNQHQLIISMSPKASYVTDQQSSLASLRDRLVSSLSPSDKSSLRDENLLLAAAQDREEDLSCLPSLSVADIPTHAPRYEVCHTEVGSVPAQVSLQPTNEVVFFRAQLGTDQLEEELQPYLPLFTGVLTQMGAGRFDYRQLSTAADLRTGGLNVGASIVEGTNDLMSVRPVLLLSSHCLERNVDEMFGLWSEVINSVRLDDIDRLKTLLSMSAATTMNGIAHMGHSYAMSNSARSLRPATQVRERNGGLEYVRFQNQLNAKEDQGETLQRLRDIAAALLNKNRMKIALNCPPSLESSVLSSTDRFLSSLPGHFDSLPFRATPFSPASSKQYFATPFPVNFCGMSVPTVPLEHPDAAPLKILAKLLSSKFLHGEIREKGGAYGGGATSGGGGVFSFFSYRDPNSLSTLETFENSVEFVRKDAFTDEHIEEAKLGVFQRVDVPISPGERGMAEFLSGVTYEMHQKHRVQLKQVTRSDLHRVTDQYLKHGDVRGVTIIGPERNDLDASWEINSLA